MDLDDKELDVTKPTKLILLEKDEYEFFKDLANKLKTQDTRGTNKPVFYQIADYETKWDRDDTDDFDEVRVYLEDGDVLESVEELRKYIINNLEMFDNTTFYINSEKDRKDFIKDIEEASLYKLVDIYNENSFNITFGHRNRILKGAYLTEEAAKNHLKENAHHYSEGAKIYCSCAWRNQEIEKLNKIIEKIYEREMK